MVDDNVVPQHHHCSLRRLFSQTQHEHGALCAVAAAILLWATAPVCAVAAPPADGVQAPPGAATAQPTAQQAQERLDVALNAVDFEGSMRMATAMLDAADQAVAGGLPDSLARTLAALRACSDQLNRHHKGSTPSDVPGFEARVGAMLVRYGLIGRAEPHLRRVARQADRLPEALAAEVQYGLLAVALRNSPANAAAAAARNLPAMPDGVSDAAKFAMLTLLCEAHERLGDTVKTKELFAARIALAKSLERRDDDALRMAVTAAMDDSAGFLQRSQRLDEAEAMLRARIAECADEAGASARLMAQARLAWVLLDKGKTAECTQLTDNIAAQLAAESVPAEVLSSALLSRYLVARQMWPQAEIALGAYWKSLDVERARPADRLWAARTIADVMKRQGKHEVAATWVQIVDGLQAAMQVSQEAP